MQDLTSFRTDIIGQGSGSITTGDSTVAPEATGGMLDWMRTVGGWPGPVPAHNTIVEEELLEERSRSGPEGLQMPWFLPFFDQGQNLNENQAMRQAYRIMLSDPNVKAAFLGKVLAVGALDLKVIPATRKDPEDAAVAEFVRFALEQALEGGVPGLIWNIVSGALIDGYSVCEKVWDYEDQGEYAGKYVLKKVKPKDTGQDIVLKTDPFRNVTKIQGLRYNAGKEFDPAHFLIFKHLPLWDQPTGQSDFRAAYQPWWMLDTVKKLWAQGLDKNSMPILVGQYARAQQKPSLANALSRLKSRNWLAIPADVQVTALEIAGSSLAAFDAACMRFKHEIFLGIQGAILQSLEGTTTEGRGDSSVHRATADLLIWYLATTIEALLNDRRHGLVRDLVDLNYAVPRYPRISLSAVDYQDVLAQMGVRKTLYEIGMSQSRGEIYDAANVSPPDPDDPLDSLGSKADQEAQIAAANAMNMMGPGGQGLADEQVADAVPGQGVTRHVGPGGAELPATNIANAMMPPGAGAPGMAGQMGAPGMAPGGAVQMDEDNPPGHPPGPASDRPPGGGRGGGGGGPAPGGAAPPSPVQPSFQMHPPVLHELLKDVGRYAVPLTSEEQSDRNTAQAMLHDTYLDSYPDVGYPAHYPDHLQRSITQGLLIPHGRSPWHETQYASNHAREALDLEAEALYRKHFGSGVDDWKRDIHDNSGFMPVFRSGDMKAFFNVYPPMLNMADPEHARLADHMRRSSHPFRSQGQVKMAEDDIRTSRTGGPTSDGMVVTRHTPPRKMFMVGGKQVAAPDPLRTARWLAQWAHTRNTPFHQTMSKMAEELGLDPKALKARAFEEGGAEDFADDDPDAIARMRQAYRVALIGLVQPKFAEEDESGEFEQFAPKKPFFRPQRPENERAPLYSVRGQLPPELMMHMHPQDYDNLRAYHVEDLIRYHDALPPDAYWHAGAHAGRAKLGWYQRAFESLMHLFPDPNDRERFTSLLAATSPRLPVNKNLRIAVKIWTRWINAGRPGENEHPGDAFTDHPVQGGGTPDKKGLRDAMKVLGIPHDDDLPKKVRDEKRRIRSKQIAIKNWRKAGGVGEPPPEPNDAEKQWMEDLALQFPNPIKLGYMQSSHGPNAFRALTHPVGAHLSGPKVNSFRQNLLNHLDLSTNDVWMANFAKWAHDDLGTDPGYAAMTAKVRQIAHEMGWHPAEVQETIWSYFRELARLRKGGPEGPRSAEQALAMIQHEGVRSTVDFATLFTHDRAIQKEMESARADLRGRADELRRRPATDDGRYASRTAGTTGAVFPGAQGGAASLSPRARIITGPDDYDYDPVHLDIAEAAGRPGVMAGIKEPGGPPVYIAPPPKIIVPQRQVRYEATPANRPGYEGPTAPYGTAARMRRQEVTWRQTPDATEPIEYDEGDPPAVGLPVEHLHQAARAAQPSRQHQLPRDPSSMLPATDVSNEPIVQPALFAILHDTHHHGTGERPDPVAPNALLDWYQDHGVPDHYASPYLIKSLNAIDRNNPNAMARLGYEHAPQTLDDEAGRLAGRLSGYEKPEELRHDQFVRQIAHALPPLFASDPHHARMIQHLQRLGINREQYQVVPRYGGKRTASAPGQIEPMRERPRRRYAEGDQPGPGYNNDAYDAVNYGAAHARRGDNPFANPSELRRQHLAQEPTPQDYDDHRREIIATRHHQLHGVYYNGLVTDHTNQHGIEPDWYAHQNIMARASNEAWEDANDPGPVDQTYDIAKLRDLPVFYRGRDPDFTAIHTHLTANPHDHDAQMAMNDWLEERGLNRFKFYFHDPRVEGGNKDHQRARPFDEGHPAQQGRPVQVTTGPQGFGNFVGHYVRPDPVNAGWHIVQHPDPDHGPVWVRTGEMSRPAEAHQEQNLLTQQPNPQFMRGYPKRPQAKVDLYDEPVSTQPPSMAAPVPAGTAPLSQAAYQNAGSHPDPDFVFGLSGDHLQQAQFAPMPGHTPGGNQSLHHSIIGNVFVPHEGGHVRLFWKGAGRDVARAEERGSRLARIAGLSAPAARHAVIAGAPQDYPGEGGVLASHVGGQKLGDALFQLEAADPRQNAFAHMESRLPPDEIDRHNLFSFLVGMNDRHSGNYMLEGDLHDPAAPLQLHSIDHEFNHWHTPEQFSGVAERGERIGASDIVKPLVRGLWARRAGQSIMGTTASWMDTPISPRAIRDMVSRAGDLARHANRTDPQAATIILRNAVILQRLVEPRWFGLRAARPTVGDLLKQVYAHYPEPETGPLEA